MNEHKTMTASQVAIKGSNSADTSASPSARNQLALHAILTNGLTGMDAIEHHPGSSPCECAREGR